jgi:hypothetical protein
LDPENLSLIGTFAINANSIEPLPGEGAVYFLDRPGFGIDGIVELSEWDVQTFVRQSAIEIDTGFNDLNEAGQLISLGAGSFAFRVVEDTFFGGGDQPSGAVVIVGAVIPEPAGASLLMACTLCVLVSRGRVMRVRSR